MLWQVIYRGPGNPAEPGSANAFKFLGKLESRRDFSRIAQCFSIGNPRWAKQVPNGTAENRADFIAFAPTLDPPGHIEQLAPQDQVKVIHFAVKLAQTHQLTAPGLGELAERLSEATDPAEIVRLKSAMTRGFYGE
jgi:hypothetical protein